MNNKILVGSKYFFDKYPDYSGSDTDYVTIEESPVEYNYYMRIRDRVKNIDYIYWKKNTPEWHIDYLLNKSKLPLEVGKFLVPEICLKVGFTIEHLKQLKPVFEKLDEKHQYEKIIFESYIKNNKMELTEEQRLEAYKSYLESRK